MTTQTPGRDLKSRSCRVPFNGDSIRNLLSDEELTSVLRRHSGSASVDLQNVRSSC